MHLLFFFSCLSFLSSVSAGPHTGQATTFTALLTGPELSGTQTFSQIAVCSANSNLIVMISFSGTITNVVDSNGLVYVPLTNGQGNQWIFQAFRLVLPFFPFLFFPLLSLLC